MVSKLLFRGNTRTSTLYMSKFNCICPDANFATLSGRLQLLSEILENRDSDLKQIDHCDVTEDRLTVNKAWFYHITIHQKEM